MKADTFSALVDSMNEALEHAQGKQSPRTVTLPRPPAPFSGLAVKEDWMGLRAPNPGEPRFV